MGAIDIKSIQEQLPTIDLNTEGAAAKFYKEIAIDWLLLRDKTHAQTYIFVGGGTNQISITAPIF